MSDAPLLGWRAGMVPAGLPGIPSSACRLVRAYQSGSSNVLANIWKHLAPSHSVTPCLELLIISLMLPLQAAGRLTGNADHDQIQRRTKTKRKEKKREKKTDKR